MIEIEVNNDSWYNINVSYIEEFRNAVKKEFEDLTGKISLAMVSNEQIQLLNKMYYNLDQPTDVLSFADQEVDEEQNQNFQKDYIGEILIAPDVMKEQAPKYNNNEDQEFCRLLVHGFLHLVGYDHAKDHEAAEMKEMENKLLTMMSC